MFQNGGPRKDCQEVLVVSVKWVGQIGGPKRTARWFLRIGGRSVFQNGGPRKDCQEVLVVSVNQVGRIGGPRRTARCVFREEVLRVSFK